MSKLYPKINKVAVLGSGTMGSQIAAHCANMNIPVVLFELDHKTLTTNLNALEKLKPPPLALKAVMQKIERATYESDSAQLADCDLIIEAIVENIDLKKQLFESIQPHIAESAIIATNTSGLSINEIASVLPKAMQPVFCGIHFFNPPRFMALVELIPAQSTHPDVLQHLEGFITTCLGKEVVYAKDTAGFVGNRIGVISLLTTLHHADRLEISPDTVDALTGKLTGKASSGTYRTADVVGLDILKNVVDNVAEHEEDQAWCPIIRLPDWIEKLIADGHLGQKTKHGIYQKRGPEIFVFDPKSQTDRAQSKTIDKALQSALKKQSLAKVLPSMAASDDPQMQLLWSIHRDTMHYAACHLMHIAESVSDVDRALCAGFGWKQGIFELWQAAGFETIRDLINADIAAGKTVAATPLPEWVNAIDQFYKDGQGYAPKTKQFLNWQTHGVYERQIQQHDFEVLFETKDVCLQVLQDGIAAIHFKTKLSSIGYGVLLGINECLDLLEQSNYKALIFWSKHPNAFCAGANLYEVLVGCKLGRFYDDGGLLSAAKQKVFEVSSSHLPDIEYEGAIVDVVALGQQTLLRLRHGPLYTIAAVNGLALGGGCELILHCDATVATQNAYIGLVEVGVGILPAFGGTKEMIRRANKNVITGDVFPLAAKYFGQIAMAKVSSSAAEAIEMGYLDPATTIIAHQHELLFVALKKAAYHIDSATYPATKLEPIMPIGQTGKANILGHLTNLAEGAFISEHDHLITQYIAEIFSGEVDDGIPVSEQWLLNLERKYFMTLLETTKTQDRIEHMLKKGKPLRN